VSRHTFTSYAQRGHCESLEEPATFGGGLTVFVVGLQLGIVGIGERLDVAHEHLPAYPLHLVVAFGTLALAISLSIWGSGLWRMLATMIGLGAGMLGASAIGLVVTHRLDVVG
jgi:xanthine/uracil permease